MGGFSKMIDRRWGFALLATALVGGPAVASELKQIGTIAVPGDRLAALDVSAIDQASGRHFLADRTNKAVDVFDTTTDRYLGRVAGFAGVAMKDGKAAGALSGPDGVVIAGPEVWDPKTAGLVRILPVDGCHPSGLAFGPGGNFALGCDADGEEMPAVTVIMNAKTGAVVATIPGLGGSDEVNYNARNNQYYTASRGNPGGPALGVIDAASNALVQVVRIVGGTPHSVASSESTGHVYVPVGATGGGDGTIHIYAPEP